MNLALLAPAALAALAALLVPLAIHLQRRPEQRVQEFAALRWVSERVRPRQRLRLTEWLLLLLRLLLVAGLALWLAQPVWLEYAPRGRDWILVAPGVDPAALPAAARDAGAERRWLAPGFPPLDTPPPAGPVPVASLLRDLDTRLRPEQGVAVWVPRELAGLDAERVRLSRPVRWHVADVPAVAPAPLSTPAPVPVALRHADAAEPALRFVDAALAAWNAREPDRHVVDRGGTDVPVPETTRWLLWLGPEPPREVQEWVLRGGHALVLPPASSAAAAAPAGPLAIERRVLGRGQIVSANLPLLPAYWPDLLEPRFPDTLRRLLQEEPAPPDRGDATTLAPRSGAERLPPPAHPLADALALAIALLLLAERVLAALVAARKRA